MMCGKGGVPYTQKFLGGCIIIMIIIIIILAVFINFSEGSEAKVELSGDNDEALIQQSSGLHLLEVNGADLGSMDGKSNWSWLEYLCILLVFIFFLNCTHIAHYCFFTKSLVKKKVARNVSIEMKNLTKEPVPKDVVIVPGLV